MRHSPGWLIGMAAIALAVAAADVWSKDWARTTLPSDLDRLPAPFAPAWVVVENPGIAFGALAGVPHLGLLLTLAMGIFVAWALVEVRGRAGYVGLGLLLGGATGNAIDRLSSGAVTDFAGLRVGDRVIVANGADLAISVGLLLIGAMVLVEELRALRRTRRAA